jgi:uncharacterized protein
MPEYLAPGVYVEEVSYRSKSIEGVSTTTTGFVGPTRYGPVDDQPEIITSLADFERAYGDRQRLQFEGAAEAMHNYVWHAARTFFEQGGRRLYVQRVYAQPEGGDGRASALLPQDAAPGSTTALRLAARHPGAAGNRRVRLTLRFGPNTLTETAEGARVSGLQERDVVWIRTGRDASPPSPAADFYLVDLSDPGGPQFVAAADGSPPEPLTLDDLAASTDPRTTDEIRVVTLAVTVLPTDPDDPDLVWDGLPLDPAHARAGQADSLFARFGAEPANRAEAATLPLLVTPSAAVADGHDVLAALFRESSDLEGTTPESSELARTIELSLDGGSDGARPGPDEYAGAEDPDTGRRTGLVGFEALEDISIVAAPGSTFGYENGFRDEGAAIMQSLIGHAERMRYRIAVLDSGNDQTIGQVRALRGTVDSKYAALYYPWVRVFDPVTRAEIHLPPSGFVAGIYARNDIERGVYKAPANEVVTGAIGFETLLNKSQQDVLNPEGVNCFRFFEGRGFRLWGARTISSDPEWKYVNLRRYFVYLERSVDRGTQWAVFEPNGERLWANVRRTVEDFLFNEWQMGALLGDKPEMAYFVKCDRSTMTQNDLDNGRLVCLVGVAPLRPAEFVIFRIGQWTADRKA